MNFSFFYPFGAYAQARYSFHEILELKISELQTLKQSSSCTMKIEEMSKKDIVLLSRTILIRELTDLENILSLLSL